VVWTIVPTQVARQVLPPPTGVTQSRMCPTGWHRRHARRLLALRSAVRKLKIKPTLAINARS
jgi:hypothetical protein